MKSMITIALLFVFTCIAGKSASAQNARVQATIPFNFTVGTELMPAGTYILSTTRNSHVVTISSWAKKTYIVTTIPDSPAASRDTDRKLIFGRYGNQYFLHQVRCDSASLNFHLVPSKLEKQARANMLEAAVPAGPVLVAINLGAN